MNSLFSKSFHYLYIQVNIQRMYSRGTALKVSPKHIRRGQRMKFESEISSPQGIFFKEIQEDEELGNLTAEELQELSCRKKVKMEMIDKKMRLKTIERKYFKPRDSSTVNLLTWDMKEHLLHLYTSQPEIWNPRELAEAFPATEEQVKKLLKAGNKPLSPERLKQHDHLVLENWKKLTKYEIGNLALLKKIVSQRLSELSPRVTLPVCEGSSDGVVEALRDIKFSPTDDLFANDDSLIKTKRFSKSNQKGSFKDIITSYERQRGKDTKGEEEKMEPKRCHDLNEVLPRLGNRGPECDVTVRMEGDVGIRMRSEGEDSRQETRPWKPHRKESLHGFRQNITLEELKRLKKIE